MARKILLADDSVTAQNMGRKILADAGYEVITVNNGSAALKKISEQRPDVIVLDVYMPGYSGLEVCQRLKEVNETSRIPILLTVGKLEPFKPEEVKRVRADAFIVKPFEASELLSALSKLEDRIVPRSEPSKPGRFARATAAIDEGRFDRSMIVDEDSGWKERIRFPNKKKEKEKEAEPEEPATFRPASKDLRPVIEHKVAEAPRKPERVDLGALAPAGLPKDVTPEEIAALAAAAAQMQGKIAESTIPESEPVKTAAAAIEVPKSEPKLEGDAPKPESREEVRHEPKPEVPTPAVTFAEQKSDEQVEAKPAEIPAAVSTAASDSRNSSPGAVSPEAVEEPVTMAVGGSSPEMLPSPSRWTGVSVALAPEDAAVSLEQEMQKAYAAFAAAASSHSASATGFGESGSAAPQLSPTPVESVSPEPAVPVPASPAAEEAQTVRAAASAASDAISATAEQVQAVSASSVEQKETTPVIPVEPSSTAMEAVPEPKNESVTPPTEAAPEDKPKIEDKPQPVTTELRAQESKDNGAPAELPAQPEIPTQSAEPSIAPSAEAVTTAPPQPAEEPVRNEPDIAANTAAAWANWRESIESPAEPAAAQEMAAKAVAAGAESSPEDVTADTGSDTAIASIVDSVLADLRPKIVEEISRKFGKKK